STREAPARRLRRAERSASLPGCAGVDAMSMEDGSRRRLGRGLAALIGDVGQGQVASDPRGRNSRRVPVEFLRPNPRNPRKAFEEEDLADLTASVREKGIMQPILV